MLNVKEDTVTMMINIRYLNRETETTKKEPNRITNLKRVNYIMYKICQ